MIEALFIFLLILNTLNNTNIFPIRNSNHIYRLSVITNVTPKNFFAKKVMRTYPSKLHTYSQNCTLMN